VQPTPSTPPPTHRQIRRWLSQLNLRPTSRSAIGRLSGNTLTRISSGRPGAYDPPPAEQAPHVFIRISLSPRKRTRASRSKHEELTIENHCAPRNPSSRAPLPFPRLSSSPDQASRQNLKIFSTRPRRRATSSRKCRRADLQATATVVTKEIRITVNDGEPIPVWRIVLTLDGIMLPC
jgi:hypothetical protein